MVGGCPDLPRQSCVFHHSANCSIVCSGGRSLSHCKNSFPSLRSQFTLIRKSSKKVFCNCSWVLVPFEIVFFIRSLYSFSVKDFFDLRSSSSSSSSSLCDNGVTSVTIVEFIRSRCLFCRSRHAFRCISWVGPCLSLNLDTTRISPS